MTTVESEEFRAVDVGRMGITGYHDRAVQMLHIAATPAIWVAAIWAWVWTLPPNLEIYRISTHITVALLLKLCLAWRTTIVIKDFSIGAWACFRWLRLEYKGMQWLRRNDHNFRVTFFRPKDGSLKFEQVTRQQRLDNELEWITHRRGALIGGAGRLAVLTLAYLFLPSAYAFSFELMNQAVHDFLERWHFLFYAQLFCFYYFIVPAIVGYGFTVLEWVIYAVGAQFIPGAKLFDPVIPPKTLETMRAEQTYGSTEPVDPAQAALELGGGDER